MSEELQSSCISIVQAESSGQKRSEPAIYQVGNQTQLQLTLNVYVRITSVRGGTFRGRLIVKPSLIGLSKLKAGSTVCFSACHIHSIAKKAET